MVKPQSSLSGIFLEKKIQGGKSMFQENEGGLEVGAKIHNTNVRTLRALLRHNYIAGSVVIYHS